MTLTCSSPQYTSKEACLELKISTSRVRRHPWSDELSVIAGFVFSEQITFTNRLNLFMIFENAEDVDDDNCIKRQIFFSFIV